MGGKAGSENPIVDPLYYGKPLTLCCRVKDRALSILLRKMHKD